MSSEFIQGAARLLARLLRDQRGSQLALIALMIPPIIGISALAVDGGVLAYDHMSLQAAADAAAASAVQRYNQGGASRSANITLEAEAIAAQYGFVNGTSGVTVTVNWPPTGKITSGGSLQSCIDENLSASDQYFGDTSKIEVIVSKPISRYLSTIWSSNQINLCGRAVGSPSGGICILALDSTAAGAFTASGGATITLTGCGLFSNSTNSTDSILLGPRGGPTVTVTGGGTNGAAGGVQISGGGSMSPPATPNLTPLPDPYASVAVPSSGSATAFASYVTPYAFSYNPSATSTTCASPTQEPSSGTNITSATILTGVASPGVACYEGKGTNHQIVMAGGCFTLSAAGIYTFTGTNATEIAVNTTPSCSGQAVFQPSSTAASSTINLNGGINVTAGQTAAITAQNLNVNGALADSGALTITATNLSLNGALTVSGTLTITATNLNVNSDITVSNGGSLTLAANTKVNGNIAVNSGGTLTLSTGPYAIYGSINSSGTVTLNTLASVTPCATISGNQYYYCSTGGISVSGGTFGMNPNVMAMNTGISVSAGTLTFNSGGTYTVNMNSGLSANGGTTIFNSGTYTVNMASGIQVSGGTVTFNSSTTTFNANDGTAHGTPTSVSSGTLSLNGGKYTFYGGIALSHSGIVSLNNGGTYILDSTSNSSTTLSMTNSSSLTGTGTLVFKSSSSTYPATMMDLKNAATFNVTGPATGSTPGFAIFGDRAMPTSTQFSIENGTSLVFTGTIYLPKGTLAYQGGGNSTTSCSQLVADSFNFTNGTASYANSCSGTGVTQIFVPGPGTLVE